MKCILSAFSIRVFGKAVHALSGFGTELYVEDTGDGLSLKSVNSSRSCFGSIKFDRAFFQEYDSPVTDDTDPTRMTCKVSMKSALTIFKHPILLERTVDKCAIKFDPQDDTKIVFEIYCQHDILKTNELFCMDSEKLGAIYRKNECSNIIMGSCRLFMEAVKLLRSSDSDVTLGATIDSMKLTNYADDDSDRAQQLYSELTLDKDEFQSFSITNETTVTFSLKELKAVLLFAELDDWAVSVRFSEPGKPVIFTTESQPTVEADFVFATMDAARPDDHEIAVSRTSSPTPITGRITTVSGSRGPAHKTVRPSPVNDNASVTVSSGAAAAGTSSLRDSSTRISLPTPSVTPRPVNNEDCLDSIDASLWDDVDWPEDVFPVIGKLQTARSNQILKGVPEQQQSEINRNTSRPGPSEESDTSNPSKRFKSILAKTSIQWGPVEDSCILASDTDDDDDSD